MGAKLLDSHETVLISFRLRYGFFAHLAELIHAEMAPLLPQLLPHVLQSLDFEDCIDFGEKKKGAMAALVASINQGDDALRTAFAGQDMFGWDGFAIADTYSIVRQSGGDGESGDTANDDESGDDDGDDDDDNDDGPRLSIRTALLDEKAAAAHCIGECAKHIGSAFAPHVEVCLRSLLAAHDYFHQDVRGASCRAFSGLVTASAKAEGVPAWAKGAAATSYTLPAATVTLLEEVVPVLMEHFFEDDDKDTVAAAAESLTEMCTALGPAVATPLAPKLMECAVSLLDKGHACMQDEEEDVEALDADDDHDAGLWEAVSELLTAMPKIMGEYYLVHFARLMPQLLPYLSAEHPASDRSLAMGIIAESLHQLELAGTAYFTEVLPHAVRCSSDDDVTTRQNSTFCLGILGQFGGPAALDAMQTILNALQPRLAASEDDSVRDNAVSALSRLVLAFESKLPVATILPAIVNRLPLRADTGENTACARAVMQIAQNEATRAHLVPHMSHMLSSFSELLVGDEKLATSQLRTEIRSFLRWMLVVAPDLKASLCPEVQSQLTEM